MSTTGTETSGSTPGNAHSCADGQASTRALVVGFIVVVCGLAVAGVLAFLAGLVAALLRVDAVGIFTTCGSTFGGSLTLEIGLAGLYAAFRRRVP